MRNQSSPNSSQSLNQRTLNLANRLEGHPEFQRRVEELLAIIENKDDTISNIHNAEEYVIEQVQAIGKATLQDWAEQYHNHQNIVYRQQNPELNRSHQKNSIGTADLGNSQS